MLITRISTDYPRGSQLNPFLTADFSMSEFFHQGKTSNHPDQHELFVLIPNAVQTVRNYFNARIKVNGTVRFPGDSYYSSTSQHEYRRARAIDFKFLDNKTYYTKEFHREILTEGQLFQELRALGVTGIGLYDRFIHLDFRTSLENEVGRSYDIWDNRVSTYQNYTTADAGTNSQTDNNTPEQIDSNNSTGIIDTITTPINNMIKPDDEDGSKNIVDLLKYIIPFFSFTVLIAVVIFTLKK